jgi:ribosome maturation factor RimP
MLTEDQVIQILQEKFKDPELEGCFVVDIELDGTSKLRVFIDSEKGVSFSECRKISRFLEERIEQASLMNLNYLLEVSSPGVDRPLKFRRQYPKHIGRKLEVLHSEEKTVGSLKEVTEDYIILEVKEGKKNEIVRSQKIEFKSIASAKVLISFN